VTGHNSANINKMNNQTATSHWYRRTQTWPRQMTLEIKACDSHKNGAVLNRLLASNTLLIIVLPVIIQIYAKDTQMFVGTQNDHILSQDWMAT
jgi:hypothetical protein